MSPADGGAGRGGAGRAVRAPETTGLVVVDKAPGWTSHDVVARCRRLFGQRRVGHAGTLDPDATGVLLVGLGRATRLLRYLSALGKVYRGEIVLGVATSTLDASGEVVGEWDMSGVGLPEARRAAAALTGEIEQVPPMVSAVKVGGRPLHTLARQGIEVPRAPRPVTVERFDLRPGGEPGVLAFEVACSSGTYVRVLADDLGRALGGGAHLRALRRTAIGPFTLDEAHPVEEVGAGCVLPPAEAVRHLAAVSVPPEAQAAISHGGWLDRAAVGAHGAGPWAVLDAAGTLLAVYHSAGQGRMVPSVVLVAPV